MENLKVKKVVVELENGNKLEFDKEVVIFAEDEMSETEKRIHNGQNTKICGIISCCPNFMANVTQSMLGTLRDQMPGLDDAVMMEHLNLASPLMSMLEKVFGE